MGEVRNIRGKETFRRLALKRIPASTYKSLQYAPISEWGEKRLRSGCKESQFHSLPFGQAVASTY